MKTTLNIKKEILRVITLVALKRGISRSDLIILLLKETMKDISGPDTPGTLVRYQERGDTEDWHKFHIRLRIDDYEYFLDLRKLLKMSVARILAEAVNRYLVKKSKGIGGSSDQFKNYVIIKEIFNNTICWKLIWGYPEKIEHLLQY